MSKRVLKVMSLIMALVLMLSTSSLAFATEETTPADDEIITRYTTISNTSTAINISGITATCSGMVASKYKTTLKIKLELQKKKSSGYETVKTWSGSKSNTTAYQLSGSRAINILSKYRVKATYTAGSETTTIYAY